MNTHQLPNMAFAIAQGWVTLPAPKPSVLRLERRGKTKYPELIGLDSRSREYRIAYKRLWNAAHPRKHLQGATQ